MSGFTKLPNNVVPILYDLCISVDLDLKTFHGKLKIDVNIVKITNSIVLNSCNLLISKVILNEDVNGEVSYLDDQQKINLDFQKDLHPMKSVLYIEYSGILNSSMKGFYHSSYLASDGTVENIAVTHFEPTNARYAFPCWDEPAYRSKFNISISTEKGLKAISNMPLKNSSVIGKVSLHEFHTSPSMSTYLVAFAVGNLDEKKLPGKEISVFCRRNTPDDWASFALDVGSRAIDFYNKWFGIEYSLPKLDMFAVPDFAGGAMENWGLVTFRERALLVSNEETSMSTKQRVALIISHELAHMWFGNLVTLEWWTDLWLKEGFAKWMEYYCVDHCFPNYEIWNQFSINEYLRTMKLDSMLSTHPIEVEVKSPEEISEIFDTISYAKGASVIRMLFDYLGEKDFQTGLRQYLQTYKFKATKTEDLWNSLQKCTSKPVKSVMNSWTKQSGYPIVSVTMQFSQLDNSIESIEFSQKRFFQSGENLTESTVWSIPITIANCENPREEILRFVMETKEHKVNLSHLNKKYQGVFVNPSAIGIYRVDYRDKSIVNVLKNCLSLPTWSCNDKFSFLEDCFALTNSGKIPYGEVLDMLEFMKLEKSFIIWEMVESNLVDLHNLLDESVHGVANIHNFIKKIAINHYTRLGWTEEANDNHDDMLLRPLIIRLLSLANHEEIFQKAREIFMNFIKHGTAISPNLRNAIYNIIGLHATDNEFQLLNDRFVNCKSGNEQSDIISSLGNVPIHLQDKFKNWILSDQVRKQDKLIGLIAAANRSSKHRELIWTVVQSHWIELREMYAGQFLMGSLLKGCLNGFCSVDKAQEIKEFFVKNESTSPRNVSQVIEKIESNAKRLHLHTDHVHDYLIHS